ncbi:MAG: hypothetical protein EZS28_021309 [Streblomastix strix]|uniref:Right handed beta helix domain-containing protein n=1 Tax=Streblomastix strix TaxID=222440 RepID=A0A5J4VL10_9EUKA|nr:MAG: hypothetical protein EZS28_021309 [Streblomastix strix]
MFITGNGNYNPALERIDLEGMKIYNNSADKGGLSIFVAMSQLKELCYYGIDGQYIKGNYSDTDSDEQDLEGIQMQFAQFNSAQQNQIEQRTIHLEEYWKLPFELICGGAIYAQVSFGGNLTIDGLCKFAQCYTAEDGSGIWAQISGVNSLLTLEDGLKFDTCQNDSNYSQGGGIYFEIYGQATSIINNVQFSYCNASSGGGVYLYGRNQVKQIFDGTKFTNCEAYYDGGGLNARIDSQNSVLELINITFENCNVIGDNSKGGGLYLVVNTNISLLISETCLFKNCSSGFVGGGCSMICEGSEIQIQITGKLEFENCSSKSGGGMRININNQATVDINQISFKDCLAQSGGGLYADIKYGGKLTINGICSFLNCESLNGGGIYSYIISDGQLIIMNQCIFTECESKSGSGGGIYSNVNDGIIKIEDAIFDRCACSQPGNGGGIALIQGSSSIISITNSSFNDSKTISNSLDQRYGWGGEILQSVFIEISGFTEDGLRLSK